MKKLLPFLLIAFWNGTSAQITLEHTYTKSNYVTVVNIEDEGNKFLVIDTATKNVILYNEDHSLWKRINTTIPTGSTFQSVACVSSKLMDLDKEVELAFTFYTPGLPTPTYTTRIYEEDGTIKQTLSGVYYINPFRVNASWKIVAYRYLDYATDIYSVPGKYLNISKPGTGDETSTTLYPNPVEYAATLKYALPPGTHSANVSVYDMTGKEVRTYTVTDHFTELLISRDGLSAGTYIYKLHTTTETLFTDRFLIK